MRLIWFLLLVCAATTASSVSMEEIRSLYLKSKKDEASCKALLKKVENINHDKEPVLAGYKGCATMIMAEHSYNPAKKLSFFHEGKDILDQAILNNSSNAELRFLRFTVQTNAPSFLGYNKSIENDKKFLLSQVNTLSDAGLKKIIADYLRKSDRLTAMEKSKLP